ncbi:hypothetical protein [uncultured Roseobacter sp.]|uniref:hypothetical protein n=1 Tax=uncultured Roseobacter sp. TaxID=114847 RepID=UPI00262D1F12|nr:hypothetical protein [uncultured Roseobacter sp.]
MPENHMTSTEEAMGAALTQYANTMGKEFPTVPRLELSSCADFEATAEIEKSDLVVTVSDGLVKTVIQFWDEACAALDMDAPADIMAHNSLTWLMLHELHHYELGHFDLTGKRSLTEAKDANIFGVASRATVSLPPALKDIAAGDLPKIEPCLEMQADADASEMVLDAYSSDGWNIIRARAAAISGMMMLIEREDAKRGHDLSSHPKAATRIFQLLGHVMEMPLIEAKIAQQHPELRLDATIPSDEEQSTYNRQVTIPAFLDAVDLALIANANNIREDLGEPADFFGDVQIAKLADPDDFPTMTTEGGVQWAGLVRLNGMLLAELHR